MVKEFYTDFETLKDQIWEGIQSQESLKLVLNKIKEIDLACGDLDRMIQFVISLRTEIKGEYQFSRWCAIKENLKSKWAD